MREDNYACFERICILFIFSMFVRLGVPVMNATLAARVLGAVALAAVVWAALRAIPALAPYIAWLPLAGLIGLVVGFVLTPLVFGRQVRRLDAYLRDAPVEDLFVALLGLAAGLVIAALLAAPLALLGAPVGNLLPTIVALVVALTCMRAALLRRGDVRGLFAAPWGGRAVAEQRADPNANGAVGATANEYRPRVLLDTSAIIDGRIADISATGFINGEILIPRFVLDELQHIADSPDVLRRTRGRRGLDMLNRMSKEEDAPITIMDVDQRDLRDVHEVDAKLVQVARKLHVPIITNDWNLNKIAQLQGVRVLNLNELALAVKPVVLPNEEMTVKIIQPGKEQAQGVSYLDDGTMIVVEDGARYIDQEIDIVITRNLQTVAGRMIFATIKGHPSRGPYSGMRGR